MNRPAAFPCVSAAFLEFPLPFLVLSLPHDSRRILDALFDSFRPTHQTHRESVVFQVPDVRHAAGGGTE